jgi:hypothetical protein
VWFPTDAGYLDPAGGTVCPTPPPPTNPLAPLDNRTLCPNYSSGIAPPIVDTLPEKALIPGPFSDSPCDHSAIGDDYEFENGEYMALEKFRWVGAGGGRLTIELWDDSSPPKFIEDIVTGTITEATAVRTLRFIPTLPIPPKGFVVIRVASQFSPNGRTYWVSTDAPTAGAEPRPVDEGKNNTTKLWVDNGVVTNFLQECEGGSQDGTWCDPNDFSVTASRAAAFASRGPMFWRSSWKAKLRRRSRGARAAMRPRAPAKTSFRGFVISMGTFSLAPAPNARSATRALM